LFLESFLYGILKGNFKNEGLKVNENLKQMFDHFLAVF